jgi:hypothetical protein
LYVGGLKKAPSKAFFHVAKSCHTQRFHFRKCFVMYAGLQKWPVVRCPVLETFKQKLFNSSHFFPIEESFAKNVSNSSHFLLPCPFAVSNKKKPKLPGRSPPAACFDQAGEPGAHEIGACMTAKS